MMVSAPKLTLLLADGDVIIRVALGDYLRSCGFIVLEAADCAEAKAVLQSSDLTIAVLICDAQLAGDDNGFAVAQWVRRRHPAIEVLLTTTLANKARIAANFCGRHESGRGPSDAIVLASRIRGMTARKRRKPPATSGAAGRQRTIT